MLATSLTLAQFRNYGSLQLAFPPGVVVFVGDNGHGKTNLIEALHLLFTGESFRPAQASSFIKTGFPSSALTAQVELQGAKFDVGLRLSEGRKTSTLNGNPTRTANLKQKFPFVLFSPESLAAIKDGPEQRRHLIDSLLTTQSPAQTKILADFRKALKARNRLLKDHKKGLMDRAQTLAVLESIEPIFLPLAAELTWVRLQALTSIQADFQQAARSVLELEDLDVGVDYLISGQIVQNWSRSDILSAMHNRSLELRSAEIEAGQSLVGPHRHDIRVLFNGKDSRFFCSQGQQRALILSFKMAQILYHHRTYNVFPFLFLDDVLSELDSQRRSNLVRFLKDIPAQIFLTTTDLSFATDFGDRRLNVFRIERGSVGMQAN